MGQLLVPALIGAGVGAVGGAATGKNPFKAALLGAGIGAGGAGLFGSAGAAAAGTAGSGAGAGLIGGANLATAGGVGVGSGAASGLGSGLFSGFQGVASNPVSFGSGGFASNFGSQAIPNLTTNLATNVATTAPSVADDIVTQGAPNIGNVNISNLDDINPALITDPSKLSPVTSSSPKTFTDGVIDPIRPMYENPIQVTEKATKAGGYEKPLYERAYESVFNYAQKNPLDVAGLGLVASGQFGRKTPAPAPQTGNINKGTVPQIAQMLQVRRPTRFSQG